MSMSSGLDFLSYHCLATQLFTNGGSGTLRKQLEPCGLNRRELNVVYCICHCTMCLGHSFFQSALQDNLFKITKVEA